MAKNTKTICYDTWSVYELDGSIETAAKKLASLKKDILSENPEATNIRLDGDTEYGAYGAEDRSVIKIYFDRPETKKEIADRKKEKEKRGLFWTVLTSLTIVILGLLALCI